VKPGRGAGRADRPHRLHLVAARSDPALGLRQTEQPMISDAGRADFSIRLKLGHRVFSPRLERDAQLIRSLVKVDPAPYGRGILGRPAETVPILPCRPLATVWCRLPLPLALRVLRSGCVTARRAAPRQPRRFCVPGARLLPSQQPAA
jgi:hypothetical protein